MPTAFAQWATHDETRFLAHGAFEFRVAHADEHDARFALCLNELNDVVRHLLDAVGESQADYQHFGNAAPLFHACVCGAQNGEHRDAVDGMDEMLFGFRRGGHFGHEHAFRQRSLDSGTAQERGVRASVRSACRNVPQSPCQPLSSACFLATLLHDGRAARVYLEFTACDVGKTKCPRRDSNARHPL